MRKLFYSLAIILLSASCERQAPPKETTPPPKPGSLEENLGRPIDDPDLSTFKHALITAGLQDIFIGTGPFTVFGPTNAAFEKFGKKRLEALLKPENKDELVSILIFHFVPGKYTSQMLQTKSYRTINGKTLEVSANEGNISVNNAKIVKTDLTGPNGVIHEIDAVLVP